MSRLKDISGIAFALAAATWTGAQTKDGGIYVPGPANSLTPAEAASGYQMIWNGKDLSGWKSLNHDSAVSSFAVAGKAGTENNAPPSNDPDSNVIEISKNFHTTGIFTIDTGFQDFDWMVEFQTPADRTGSSGLMYRYSEKSWAIGTRRVSFAFGAGWRITAMG